jgi:cell division protein FtsZ
MAKKQEKPKKKKTEQGSTKKIRIKIVGIGGGGGNIIKELAKKLDFASNKIDFVAINTDTQALESLPKNLSKVAIGNSLTNGLGTGRDFELGREVAEQEEAKIKKVFSDSKDLYILVSSLGGGTGTGAIPVFARIAKELELTTFGIFTLPFNFEGREKQRESQKTIEKAIEDLNALLVLPNEKIFSIASEDIPFNDALDIINSQLADSLTGLLNTIYSSGLINIDWADIQTTIAGEKKKAYLNMVSTKVNDDLDEFTDKLLTNILIEYNFKDSTNVLFNIEGGKNLSMKELTKISEKIHALAPSAKIIFGLTQNPKLKNEIRATVLATGVEKKEEKKPPVVKKEKPVKKKKKVVKKVKPKPKKIVEEKTIEDELKELEDMGVEINRKNALDIQKEKQEEIKREEDEESIFEIPAFLRKKDK